MINDIKITNELINTLGYTTKEGFIKDIIKNFGENIIEDSFENITSDYVLYIAGLKGKNKFAKKFIEDEFVFYSEEELEEDDFVTKTGKPSFIRTVYKQKENCKDYFAEVGDIIKENKKEELFFEYIENKDYTVGIQMDEHGDSYFLIIKSNKVLYSKRIYMNYAMKFNPKMDKKALDYIQDNPFIDIKKEILNKPLFTNEEENSSISNMIEKHIKIAEERITVFNKDLNNYRREKEINYGINSTDIFFSESIIEKNIIRLNLWQIIKNNKSDKYIELLFFESIDKNNLESEIKRIKDKIFDIMKKQFPLLNSEYLMSKTNSIIKNIKYSLSIFIKNLKF